MITTEEVLDKIKDIPSNVKDGDSALHVKYLSNLPDNPLILDFGTGWGKLIVSIALACPQAEIYTFDPGLPYVNDKKDILDYENKVKSILISHLGKDLHFQINNSYKYEWDRQIDVLSIDSSHTYEDTKYEVERYWPLVKSGGLILMHDYNVPTVGVKEAVDEYMNIHKEYTILETNNENDGFTTVIKKNV